jgi:hypothetical protein
LCTSRTAAASTVTMHSTTLGVGLAAAGAVGAVDTASKPYWLAAQSERDQYARERNLRAAFLAEEIIDIAARKRRACCVRDCADLARANVAMRSVVDL